MPKNPYLLSVRDLIHRPGEHREKELEFAAPEQLGEAVLAIRAGEMLNIRVQLEGLSEGILATGQVKTKAHGECVRCLDPVTLPLKVNFQELFGYSASEGFDLVVHQDRLNLEPAVRDSVVLALPFAPLCRPDCPGLDPKTGAKRVASVGTDQPIDPRFTALQGFFDTAEKTG